MTDGRRLRVGITQWHATTEVAANLATAVELIAQAAERGADLVVLPENGLMLGTNAQMREQAFTETGPEITTLAAAAAEHGVTVVLGGMKNRTSDGVFNSALVIDRTGAVLGRYDKVHLFDARVGTQSFEASGVEQRGSRPVILDLDGVRIGIIICYDVRFPELSRALAIAGAEVLLVPSAFTHLTGSAHWHTLLRARAIENASYVVAPATIRGNEEPRHDAFETYGHALAVSPWGDVIADLGETPRGVEVVELDLAAVTKARSSLPVLLGVQPAAYATEPLILSAPQSQEEAS